MTNDHLPPTYWQSLAGLREELDGLDAQLTALLAKRFSVTTKVGELKAAYGADAADATREAAQLERLVALSREHGLPLEATRSIFETVFGLVRENHRHIARARASSRTP